MSKNDYVYKYPNSLVDLIRNNRPDLDVSYYGCSYCHYETDTAPIDMSCPLCEEMPLELCDLCGELESPRYFIIDGNFKYCPNAEDYYFQRNRNGGVFLAGNRYFKFNIDNGSLIEVTELEHA